MKMMAALYGQVRGTLYKNHYTSLFNPQKDNYIKVSSRRSPNIQQPHAFRSFTSPNSHSVDLYMTDKSHL